MICPHCHNELIITVSKPTVKPLVVPTAPVVHETGVLLRDTYRERPSYHKRPVGNLLENLLYCGQFGCDWMFTNKLQVVAVVAQSIANDFPEAFDKNLVVGDCSPISGQCEFHPVGSHNNLIDFDGNYYVTGDYNYTQYVPVGATVIPLTVYNFDWERTFLFLYRLRQVAPLATVRVHSAWINKMKSEVEDKYGREVFGEFSIFEDDAYNHKTHLHASMIGDVNYDFKISNFLRRK